MFNRTRFTTVLLLLLLTASGCATTSVQETDRETGPKISITPVAIMDRTPGETDATVPVDPDQESYLFMAEIRGALEKGSEIGSDQARQLIQRLPDSSYGRFLAGMIYMRDGEIENAIIQFQRSSELDPANDRALSALGRIFQGSGDLAQADLYYSKAFEASSTPQTANQLALLRIQGGYVESATRILQKTLSDYPQNAMTRNNLAVAMDILGTTSEGIEILAGDEITDPRLLQTRALLQLKEGHPESAVPDLSTGSVSERPEGQSLLLGIADLQQGKLDKAEEKFRLAIKASASDYEGYLNLGLTLRRQGRFTEAEKIYQEGLIMAPHPDLHLNLGVLYELYRGQPSEALEQYRQYLMMEGPAADRVRGWAEYLEGVVENN